MEKDRKFRALAIAAICVAIVGVSVAYAALTATLTITGTATVQTQDAWKIEWKNTTTPVKSSAVTVTSAPTITTGNQEITWAATFAAPKTQLTFDATFQNTGTIPAKLVAGTYVAATGDASSNFTYSVKVAGTDIADKAGYILEAGTSVTVTVTVDFDAEGTLTNEQLTDLHDKTAVFTLNLPWAQATDTEVAAGTKF